MCKCNVIKFSQQKAGLIVGDVITEVAGDDTKWSERDDVIRRIQRSGNKLHLKVVTPLICSFLKTPNTRNLPHQQLLARSAKHDANERATSKSLDRTFNRRVNLRKSDERSKSKPRNAKKLPLQHRQVLFDH